MTPFVKTFDIFRKNSKIHDRDPEPLPIAMSPPRVEQQGLPICAQRKIGQTSSNTFVCFLHMDNKTKIASTFVRRMFAPHNQDPANMLGMRQITYVFYFKYDFLILVGFQKLQIHRFPDSQISRRRQAGKNCQIPDPNP